MKNIFIFSGTSEGKMISEALDRASVFHTVFVATEYGEMVMEPSPFTTIKMGRLEKEEMTELFKEASPEYVIDATHPYATVVTENIKSACKLAGINNYIRVARKKAGDDFDNSFTDTEKLIEALKTTEGNILLTTGVKTLPLYMAEEELKDRIYVRILPSLESLTLAFETRIKPGHIIAMEGPFSVESNEALISQYDIKVLVTKNSGERGGFNEKMTACKNKGIKAFVISQKEEDFGISAKEVIKKLTRSDYINKSVTIAGIGAGDLDSLTLGVNKAIEQADLIIGAKRMVDFSKKINKKAKTFCEYDAEKITEIIEKSDAEFPLVLMSGDTGFHSGALKTKEELEKRGYTVKLLPGISSISYFASKIGWDYDAKLLSLHGEDADLESLRDENKFFCILSGPEDIKKVTSVLKNGWEVAVGVNLGYEDMRIDIFKCDESIEYTSKGLYVLAARKVK